MKQMLPSIISAFLLWRIYGKYTILLNSLSFQVLFRGLNRKNSNVNCIEEIKPLHLEIFAGFVKECKFDTIHVSLRRSMLRGAVPTDLQLNDPACAASVNETHFFFTIRHGKCATKSRSTGLRVEISNSINYRSRGSYIFSIPVKCSYTKMDRTAFAARALQIMHDERFVSVWLGAKYHFSQKTVLDSSVVDLIGSMPLNVITTETDGVLDTVITAKDENLDFVIDHCKIKPSPASIRKQTLVINE